MKGKILICLLFLFSLVFLVSCNKEEDVPDAGDIPSVDDVPSSVEHEHTYSKEWNKDDTSHWHQATCEHASEVKDKEAHTFDSGVVKDGKTIYTCTVCSYFKEVSNSEHTHESDGKYYNNANFHWEQCSCGEEMNKKSHRWDKGTIVKEPTTEVEGLKIYKCKTCGYEKEEVIKPSEPEHNHVPSDIFEYNEECHWQACNECGEILKKDVHTFDRGKEFSDEKGQGIVYTCMHCGYQKAEYSDVVHECKPTSRDYFSDEYSHWHECECGALIDYADHTFEITYSDTYETHYACSLCKYTKIEYSEHVHEFSTDFAWDEFSHWRYALCGCDVTEEYGEHEFNAWNVIAEPSIGSEGLEARYCMVCSFYEERTIPALECTEHEFSDSYMYDEEKHWQYCSYCDATRNEGLHEMGEWQVLWAPTEFNEGLEERYCVCGLAEQRSIPKTEHVHEVWGYSTSLEPTNTSTGIMVGNCVNCGEEVSVTLPILNDIDYVIDNIYTPSTCQAQGEGSYRYEYNGTYYWFNGYLPYAEHSYVNGKCEICETEKVTVGLEYVLDATGESYWITGIGTCADTVLDIPAEYNGLPVSRIEKYAFKDCTQLTSITIPDGISVLEGAFSGCYNIESVTLPTGAIYDVTNRNTYPLGYIFGFEEYENSYDAWQWTLGADNYGYHYYIPNGLKTITLTGDSTKSTGVSAFDALTSLETVYLAEEFECIGSGTFQGCSNLSYINVKDTNVTQYNNQAFYGCAKLSSDLLLYEGLTTLKAWALAGCVGLDSNLVIPESVKFIEHSVFRGLTHLESITLSSFGTNDYSHFAYLFGNQQFNEADLVPEGLKEITIRDAMVFGNYAFYDINNLEKLNLNPDSTLESGSIRSCGTTIYTEYNNAYYLATSDSPHHWLITMIDFNATEFIIAEDCKKIVNNAFLSYLFENKINSLVIPDSVEYIGYGALNGLSNLAELTIPFVGSSLDETIEYDTLSVFGSIFGNKSFNGSYEANGYYIPTSLKKVTIGTADYGQYAFKNVTSLEELVIINGHTDAWTSDAFVGCSNLKTLYVADLVYLGSLFGQYSYDNSYKVTYSIWVSSIGQMKYIDYYIPNSLTDVYVISGDIKESAFRGCSSIKNLTISGGTVIEEGAFSSCNFETVAILDSFTSIPNNAFNYMTSLKEVTLCDTITSIGNYAFNGCSSLKEVILPDSIEYIGSYAFSDCTSLENINTLGKVTSIGEYTFNNCSNLKGISLENVTSVGTNAFANCLVLEEVVMNEASYIASNAFDGCDNISKVSIKYTGSSLPTSLFTGKENLTYVSIEANTTFNIPERMFENCTKLETLELLFTISSIGDYAFAGCSSLKELHLPSTIAYIGKEFLAGANSLESLTIPYIGDDGDNPFFGYIFGADSAETQAEYVPNTLTKVTINGDGVIPTNAFNGLSSLTYLDLSTCQPIEKNALMGCSNLETLYIPNLNTTSPYLGFLLGAAGSYQNHLYVPTTLKELHIYNVEKLYGQLLYNVTLDSLYIDNNLTQINDPFSMATITNVYFEGTIDEWLNNIYLQSNTSNPNYSSKIENFYQLDENGEWTTPTSLTLSKEKVSFEAMGFENVKEITIENTVTRFYADFSGYELDKVYYNGTLKEWFATTFSSNTSNFAKYANEFYYKNENGEYVLLEGTLVIPEGVEVITAYSALFKGLTGVVLPSTLRKFDSSAFDDLSSLNLAEYGNCYYMGTSENAYYMLVSVIDTSVTDVDIHNDTVIIASHAFKNSSVTELVVPDTVKTIEKNAFSTNSLTKITLPLANLHDKDANGVVYFKNMFLVASTTYGKMPESLTTVVITSGDSIPKYYFNGCENVTSLTLPEGVTFDITALKGLNIQSNEYKNAYYIGSESNPYMILFKGIDNTATSFEVHPDTLMYQQGALNGFASLEELSINNITYDVALGSYFEISNYKVTSNTSVPTTLKTVKLRSGELTNKTFANLSIENFYITKECGTYYINAKYDFGGFTSLTNLYFDGSMEDWCSMEFNSESATPMYYASNFFYKNEIGEYVEAKEIDLSNVYSVGDYQFYGFANLETVIFNEYVSLSDKAFVGCDNLHIVGYKGNVSYDFADKFSSLNIDSLVIKDTSYLYSIPRFNDLKNLYLPGNLYSVDSTTFENYTTIENIYYDGTLEDWCLISFSAPEYNPMGKAEHFYLRNSEGEYAELTKIEISTPTNYSQFAGLKSLEEVVILEGGSLGYYALYGCTNIKTLTGHFNTHGFINTFKDNMDNISAPKFETVNALGETIYAGTFYSLTIENVNIADTVTSIGSTAFSNTNITNLYIPVSVTKFGSDAFVNATITNVYYDGTLEDWLKVDIDSNPMEAAENFYIKDSNGEYTTITKVEADYIGSRQFSGLKSLEEVVLLNGGTIEPGALHNCPNLKHLTISLDSFLSNYYNGDVSSLESLTINGEAIGSRSLSGLTIKNLIISNSVKEIGIAAFENSKITNLYFDGTVDEWCGINIKLYDGSYLYQNNNPITYSDNFYVRNSDNEYERITKLVISAEAGNYQFTGLKQLEEVVVLEGGKLGDYSLYDTSVTKLTLTAEEKRIGVYFSETPDGYNLPDFDYLTFTGEVIPTGVLGYISMSIENLYISNTVKQINTKFNGVKITNLYYDGTIDEWFNMSFAQLESSPVQYAENLYVKNENGEYYLVTEIEISESIDTIKAYQFFGYKITSLEIPSNVKTIEAGAFQNCTSLTQLSIPNTVTYIGDNAFNGCTGLKEVVVSNEATYIGLNAFTGCTSLEKVTIPFIGTGDGTNNQFNKVFGGNSNVKEVIITNTTTIPKNAFYQNYQIEKVTLPLGLLTIESQAFNNCSSLEEINIPNTVVTIEGSALRNCSSLTEIIIPTGATVAELAFQNCTNVTKLALPALEMDLIKYFYYSSDGSYPTIPSFLPNLSELIINGGTISANAFQNATNLKTVTLNNVNIVEAYAFSGCSNLENLNIHNDSDLYQVIKGYAFQNCTGLTYLDLSESYNPESNSFIGCDNVRELKVSTLKSGIIYSIFSNATIPFETISCTAFRATSVTADFAQLTVDNVVIEEGVENVSYLEFRNCNITNLYLPSTLKSVSFADTSNITNAYYNGSIEDWTNVNVGYMGVFEYIDNFYFTVDGEYVLSTNVNSVSISDATELSSYLFANYDGLEEVVIGSQVTTIYEYTFRNCADLTVFYEGTQEEWEKVSGFYYVSGINDGIGAIMYYYSETEPTEEGNYWYFTPLGAVRIWGLEYEVNVVNTYTLNKTVCDVTDLDVSDIYAMYAESSLTFYDDGTVVFATPKYLEVKERDIAAFVGTYSYEGNVIKMFFTSQIDNAGVETIYESPISWDDILITDEGLEIVLAYGTRESVDYKVTGTYVLTN